MYFHTLKTLLKNVHVYNSQEAPDGYENEQWIFISVESKVLLSRHLYHFWVAIKRGTKKQQQANVQWPIQKLFLGSFNRWILSMKPELRLAILCWTELSFDTFFSSCQNFRVCRCNKHKPLLESDGSFAWGCGQRRGCGRVLGQRGHRVHGRHTHCAYASSQLSFITPGRKRKSKTLICWTFKIKDQICTKTTFSPSCSILYSPLTQPMWSPWSYLSWRCSGKKKTLHRVKKTKEEEAWWAFDGKPQSNSANVSGINLLENFDRNKLRCVELITFSFSWQQLIFLRVWVTGLLTCLANIFIWNVRDNLWYEGKRHETVRQDETRRTMRQRVKVTDGRQHRNIKHYVPPRRQVGDFSRTTESELTNTTSLEWMKGRKLETLGSLADTMSINSQTVMRKGSRFIKTVGAIFCITQCKS